MNEQRKCILWLLTVPGIGVSKIHRLMKSFGSVKELYEADGQRLFETGFLSRKDITALLDKRYREKLPDILEQLYRKKIQTVSILEDHYPYALANIYDPPPLLFYRGSLHKNENCLAVIGSRKATAYGMQMAEIIAGSLGERGFTIVSGLARGIDAKAHEGALAKNARTIAVLGCGVDVIYPPENKKLSEKIAHQGAVISEFLPGTEPLAFHFPQRNRIISGLSMGVIVIEAGEKSGSLITANIALDQGREVFALPGNVLSRKSIGTNRLIKEGAKIITGLEDILDELYLFSSEAKKEYLTLKLDNKILAALGEDEKKIIHLLQDSERTVEELLGTMVISVQTLQSMLIVLEMQGLIEQLPGRKVRLVRG